MKNAMKKLMSLVLVAVLLVSAVPFAASAEEAATVVLKINGNVVDTQTVNFKESPTTLAKLAKYDKVDLSPVSDATFSHTWKDGMGEDRGGMDIEINPGETIQVAYTQESTERCFKCGELVTPGSIHMQTCTTCSAEYCGSHNCAPVVNKVTIVVKKDGVEGTPYDVEIKDASTTVQNLITHKINAAEIAGMDFAAAYVSNRGYIELNDAVNAGEKVYIAFSTPATKVEPINIVLKVESSDNVVWSGEKVPANGKTATVENLLTYAWNSAWEDVYAVDHVWSHEQQKNVARGAAIEAGDTVYFMLKEKSTNNNNNNNNNNGADDDYVVDEEWMKDIWLYIYTNNDLVQPAKRVLLNDYEIIKDHVINKSNALSVVDDYFKATNSNNGIIWKGMYRETNDITAMQFVQQLGRDDYIDNLDVLRSKGTVVIKVRVTGVTAKTSATADSSNPKTGDEIYMAVTVLGLSAASLAAVAYVYSKKRLAK